MVLRQVVASPYSGVGHVMVSIGIGAYAASRQDVQLDQSQLQHFVHRRVGKACCTSNPMRVSVRPRGSSRPPHGRE